MPEDKKGSRHVLDPFSIAAATLGTGVGTSLVFIATRAMRRRHKQQGNVSSQRSYKSPVNERVGASLPVAFRLAKRVLQSHRYATTNWILGLHYSTDQQVSWRCIESLLA